MKWIDINFRKPTKQDTNERGHVLVLYRDNSVGEMAYNELPSASVAWMYLSELPDFTPMPAPLHGYCYVTDYSEKPSKNAQYWDTILQRWGTRAYPGTAYEPTLAYIVPIEPVYRPYASAEEFSPNKDRWLNSKPNPDHYAKVVAFNSEHWYIGERPMTYQEMLTDYVFDDGTPCGIKVE